MPRWRRRRFQRARRKRRKLEAARAEHEYIRLRTHREDGQVQKRRWRIPRAKLPEGTKVWTQEELDKNGTPDGPFVMEIQINATFHQCEACEHVWQPPQVHGKEECNLMLTRQVLES